jgi:hypothetical protein
MTRWSGHFVDDGYKPGYNDRYHFSRRYEVTCPSHHQLQIEYALVALSVTLAEK